MENKRMWKGNKISVWVLYSQAGIATQILLSVNDKDILIDIGDGCLRDLLKFEYNFDRLKGILITHGHYDHVGGLHTLLGYLRMIGRKEKIVICFPRGCTEAKGMVEMFMTYYSNSIPFEIQVKEIGDREICHIGEIKVETYFVVHHGSIKDKILGQIPATGYRVSFENESIALSGDTGFCDSLIKLVKGTDLAILDATFKGKVTDEVISKVHLSEKKAKEVGKLAKEFILIHGIEHPKF